jgi:O-antigen/teichoic acid export membrane protein
LLLFGISNTSSAALLGFQQTRYTAFLDILLALVKGGLSLWLVFMGWKSFGVLGGLLLAQSLVALLGFVLVMHLTRRTSTAAAEGGLRVRASIKVLFRYGSYLGITTVLSSFGAQLYNILTALTVTSADIGYYTASQDVLALVVVLAVPLQSALLPSFSKIDGNRQPRVLNGAFRSSIRYTSYGVLPLTSIVTGLAIPLATTLFGPAYLACGTYLGYSGLIFLLASLGSLSAENLLMSQDRTKAILATKAVGLSLSIPLCFFAIPFFGVIGLITTRLFVASLSMLLELAVIYMIFRTKPDGLLAIKLLLSSGFTIAFLIFLSQLLVVDSIIELLLTGLAGLGIFFAVLFGLRGIRLADIRFVWNLLTTRNQPKRIASCQSRFAS